MIRIIRSGSVMPAISVLVGQMAAEARRRGIRPANWQWDGIELRCLN